jgi:hypothetical protein
VAFRTRQLACLLVLLSTLGLSAAASSQQPGFRGTQIAALLYRHAVRNSVAAEPAATFRGQALEPHPEEAVGPAAAHTLTTPWPLPAASAHASAIQAIQSAPARSL